MKRNIQNITIFLLFLSGWRNIWSALPFRYIDLDERILSHTFNLSLLALHHAIYLITGILMVIISFYLFQRLRMAWIFTMLTIASSLVGHLLHIHHLSLFFVAIDVSIFSVLAYGFRDFHRRSPRQAFVRAVPFMIFASVIYLAYIVTGLVLLPIPLSQNIPFKDIAIQSGKALFLMDNTLFITHSLKGKLLIDSSVTVFWSFIFIFVIFIMRPLFVTPLWSRHEKNKARPIVLAYGENPMSYLALEDDKQYFFSKGVEGLCAYTIVGNILTICGDIICADESADSFMTELLQFANALHYNILMMNISERFKDVYERFGFGFTKCGEDACFDLNQYNLKGGAVAKVRAAINHANKTGITVKEIDFTAEGSKDILTALQAISDEWIASKSSPELVFMLGKNNFNEPFDRRYFYASDSDNNIIAYCIFNPYNNRNGYIAEITRRKQTAPQGALEKIIYDAFMIFHSEGVKEATLGLSPLYNVMSDDRYSISGKAFTYIYENMSTYYNFKTLHHAKEKFAPTHWKSRYYAYTPKPFSPMYAYAIVRSQLPMKLSSMAIDAIKSIILIFRP
ncbi:MAG: DUF2156 domain-containing protein [Clostridia bacterium]|nr:DUF2156 domain-containing protein [Clostridia bacterium]